MCIGVEPDDLMEFGLTDTGFCEFSEFKYTN